jgi:hypothetical protein
MTAAAEVIFRDGCSDWRLTRSRGRSTEKWPPAPLVACGYLYLLTGRLGSSHGPARTTRRRARRARIRVQARSKPSPGQGVPPSQHALHLRRCSHSTVAQRDRQGLPSRSATPRLASFPQARRWNHSSESNHRASAFDQHGAAEHAGRQSQRWIHPSLRFGLPPEALLPYHVSPERTLTRARLFGLLLAGGRPV